VATVNVHDAEADQDQEIDVHEGKVAQILHQKGIASASIDDAVDRMTSRRNTKARINAVQFIRHIPTQMNRSVQKTNCQSNSTSLYSEAELDSRADMLCRSRLYYLGTHWHNL